METLSGWFDIIRGPRPPSQKWLLATGAVSATSAASPQLGASTPLEDGRSVEVWPSARRTHHRQVESRREVRRRLKVERLEAALVAFGNESSREGSMCTGSSEGATHGVASEGMRGEFRKVSEQVGRCPGRSGKDQGEVECERKSAKVFTSAVSQSGR